MRLRFLQTTPSSNPDYPFQPGQIIEVTKLTAEMRAWLRSTGDSGPRAEVIRDVGEESARPPSPEQPEPGKKGQGRGQS